MTGTIGTLELAATRGLVDLREVLDKLHQTNARLDPELVQRALERDAARRDREREGTKNRPGDLQP